ncbi:MAG TPA: redox-sensing transcriptional repressor Rex, partial [Levilinea sp.]|nr:redox-sensing transcriptional repressor Rex [Levilinea sp.]
GRHIPDIVVGRLPRYLLALQRFQISGVATISSQELGEKLGLTAAQIRKDLSQFGEFGKQGTGYSVNYLIDQLSKILKINRVWGMALVGAGNLGRAIAHYHGFTDRGFCITHIFDNDPDKIGAVIADFVVHDIKDMAELTKKNNIKIAMLTVPSGEAQAVADQLISAGVQAILNYAPTQLSVPPGIRVQYIDPIFRLQHMTYYLD